MRGCPLLVSEGMYHVGEQDDHPWQHGNKASPVEGINFGEPKERRDENGEGEG